MEQAPTIADEQAAIAEEFELLDDWRDRIEYVLELGKQLPPIAPQHQVDANKVRGCQSQVWMLAHVDREAGRMRIEADSDAYIVKGLIALLLRLYSNRPPAEILKNPPKVFEEIGLGAHLTPGRANGLHAMIGRIRHLAAAASGGVPETAAG